jgi:hypothetical protein
MIDPRGHGRRLSVVAPEFDHTEMFVVRGNRFRDGERPVAASVVHENDLAFQPQRGDTFLDRFIQGENGILLVVKRRDHGQIDVRGGHGSRNSLG